MKAIPVDCSFSIIQIGADIKNVSETDQDVFIGQNERGELTVWLGESGRVFFQGIWIQTGKLK